MAERQVSEKATSQQTPQEPLAASTFEPRQEVVAQKRSKLQPRLLALTVGGVFLAYSLFFLLTARSVTITADTMAALEIRVSGLNIPFGDRLLMRPGSYALSVAADGYYPFEGTLEVDTSD